MADPAYANIRNIIGHFVGLTLVDITQHDEDEWNESKESYVCLLFDNGNTLTFPVGDDGFKYEDETHRRDYED